MFISKATANGNHYVREHLKYNLKVLPDVAVAGRSCHIQGHTYLQTKGSPIQ